MHHLNMLALALLTYSHFCISSNEKNGVFTDQILLAFIDKFRGANESAQARQEDDVSHIWGLSMKGLLHNPLLNVSHFRFSPLSGTVFSKDLGPGARSLTGRPHRRVQSLVY